MSNDIDKQFIDKGDSDLSNALLIHLEGHIKNRELSRITTLVAKYRDGKITENDMLSVIAGISELRALKEDLRREVLKGLNSK